jgi:hypothetical protein
MSIALGNNKPEPLLEIEKIMWRALFSLAGGLKAPEDVLSDLLVQIPWQRFQPPYLLPPQQEWFSIQATPVLAAPEQNAPLVLAPLPVATSSVPAAPHNYAMEVWTAPNATNSEEILAMQVTLPVGTASILSAQPIPDDSAMDVSPDCQEQPPILEPQAEATEIDASGRLVSFEGFGSMNEDSPRDDPSRPASPRAGANDLPDIRSQALNTAPVLGLDSGLSTVDAITYRRSTRLAREEATKETAAFEAPERYPRTKRSVKRRRKTSMEDPSRPITPEHSSRSVSPEDSSRSLSPEGSARSASPEQTTTLKRKALTRDTDVEKLLSAGGSAARPIDVDALNAVLKRYPVKREPQVRTYGTASII